MATRRANPHKGAGGCDAVPAMIVHGVVRVRPAGSSTDPNANWGVDLQISWAILVYGKLVGGSDTWSGSCPSRTRRRMAFNPASTPLITRSAGVVGVAGASTNLHTMAA